jgi:hypothetical protein
MPLTVIKNWIVECSSEMNKLKGRIRSGVCVCLLICLPHLIFSQTGGTQTQIFIEGYQPITTNGLDEIYNDDWGLAPSSYTSGNYSRNYFSNAFGIGVNHLFKNELVGQFRAGITVRKAEESRTDPERYYNGTHDLIFEDQYNYRQNHLNLFGGIAKRFSTVHRVYIVIGAELTYLHYFQGSSEYNSRSQYLDVNESQVWGGEEYRWKKDHANANLLGIGPLIRLEIEFSRNFSFGFQPQVFYSYVWSQGSSVIESYNSLSKDAEHNAGVDYFWEGTYTNTTKFNFRQSAWTNISPLIFIAWKFGKGQD